MQSEQPQTRAFEKVVPLAEAARLAGRSYRWAFACSRDGRLDRGPIANPITVTVESLDRLLFEMQRERLRHSLVRTKQKNRPHLRLVVDNT